MGKRDGTALKNRQSPSAAGSRLSPCSAAPKCRKRKTTRQGCRHPERSDLMVTKKDSLEASATGDLEIDGLARLSQVSTPHHRFDIPSVHLLTGCSEYGTSDGTLPDSIRNLTIFPLFYWGLAAPHPPLPPERDNQCARAQQFSRFQIKFRGSPKNL